MAYRPPIDFRLDVARGAVDGWLEKRKFGRNTDIDTGSTPEDVWDSGGLYAGQPVSGSAETVDVSSTSASDTSAGTGARTVLLDGLDGNYAAQTETITLNGTTNVTSSLTWWRVPRASVMSVGSGLLNAGIITIQHTTTTANVFGTISIGKNQTATLFDTVPAGKVVLLTEGSLYIEGSTGSGTDIALEFMARDNVSGVLRTLGYYPVSSDIHLEVQFDPPIQISEKTDFFPRITSCSSNNTAVSGDMTYYIAPIPT